MINIDLNEIFVIMPVVLVFFINLMKNEKN